tara:strand:- start:171 stop:605 length:435 start_codon:yes stop_codon:yes gene_type:complete
MAKGFQGKKKGSAAEKKAIKKAQSKRKTKTKKRTSTKKGGIRKTARKAFKGLTKKRRSMPRRSSLKGLTSSSTLKKVALGVGGATLATAMISFIAPNSSLGKFAPAAGAYALGGIEGIIGNFALGMLARPTSGNQNVAPQMEVL